MALPLVFENVPLARSGSLPFSLEVPERQTIAVLGDEESGIGQLGGYALGLERPDAGRALVFGTSVAALPERERLAYRRRVGYLPAGDGLLQNLSIRDNVALPLRFGSGASPRDIEGRVNVMLAAMRLSAARRAGPRDRVRPRAADSGAAVRRVDGARVVGAARVRARGRVGGRRAPHDPDHRPGDSAADPPARGSRLPADARRRSRNRNRVS
jgi:ABC-type ATPase involved in cell division